MTAAPATNYVTIARRNLDLEDYIDIARRHVGWILGPAFAGLVISIVVAFVIPNTYVSSAEMEITPAQVSSNLVPAAVTQQLTDRIIYMENQILSRSNLSQMIQDPRLDLYKSKRAKEPLDDVIDQMQKDIRIEMKGMDENGNRHASAFQISFSYPDRVKARDTVAALVTAFDNANAKAQRQAQATVSGFTNQQVAQAKADLDKLDQTLTRFRMDNPGRLPEQSTINMSELSTLTNQLGATNDALNRLAENKATLQTRLQTVNAQIENYRLFQQTSSDYGTPVAEQNDRLLQLNKTITEMESQLAILRKTFKDSYPDVREYQQRIQVLRAERDDLQKKQDAAERRREEEITASKKNAEKLNPSNLGLAQRITELRGEAAQIETAIKLCDNDIAARTRAQAQISREIDTYKGRLAATSGIEAQYQEMLRQEQLASQKYQEMLRKQQIVDENGDLVQREAGEQLTVLDPASLPEKPDKPNRLVYIGMGFLASLLIGLALAGVQEARDTSLKNLKDVRAYTNLPVLSSIPLLENSGMAKRKRRVAYLAWSAGMIVGVVAVTAALYYHYFLAG